MLQKIAIGAAVLAIIQFSFAGSPPPASGTSTSSIQDARCAQAKQFGIEDLRRGGLKIECD